ncbi:MULTISPECIES: small secreted hydrophilic protein [Streptomyces]|uniref:small secreted hydrophilic protein n=1 Tax=Streptomyces TaxID=1883 RepID=UPI001D047FC2|nr:MULTISPECIES: small secreted hydrophilic protein [Streptomyces]
MAFSHRVAALAAVVLIPVTIAGASQVLGDDAAPPDVAPDVRLGATSPPPSGTNSPTAPPDEEVAPRPRPTETSLHDDDRRPGAGQPDDGDESEEGKEGEEGEEGDDDADDGDDSADDDGDD